MRAGRLRHPCVIEYAISTQDEAGQPEVELWGEFASVRASIEPLQGSERFRAQQVDAEMTHLIKMRYIAGVLPNMRLVCGDRIFDFKSPPMNIRERNREIQILATEKIGA